MKQFYLLFKQALWKGQLYDRVIENLQQSTPEIKRLAFDALDIQVYAIPNKLEIKGVIPLELALFTTEQTSGCLIVLYYDQTSQKESVSILPTK